jgi:transposase-like protein
VTKPIARDRIYRRRGFDAEIIELCVRWYISYRLSYRDLVELMADRGVAVSHTTIMRWVIRYVPEFEKRWNRFARPVGRSWRVDETYISVRGRWHYLYRAVDKQGKTVDFLLRPDRDTAAAQAFFRKALTSHPRGPRKVTLDGHVPSRRALWRLRGEHPLWRNVEVRTCKYLNNIVEQGPPGDQATLCIHDGVQIVPQRVDHGLRESSWLIGFASASSRSVADGLLVGQ